jgi:hypothetical protein
VETKGRQTDLKAGRDRHCPNTAFPLPQILSGEICVHYNFEQHQEMKGEELKYLKPSFPA